MIRAVRVVHEKIKTAQGVVVEFKVWRIPKSEYYPEGVKYSFFAVHGKRILVGYDNHRPKATTDIFRGKKNPTHLPASINFGTTFEEILEEALKEME